MLLVVQLRVHPSSALYHAHTQRCGYPHLNNLRVAAHMRQCEQVRSSGGGVPLTGFGNATRNYSSSNVSRNIEIFDIEYRFTGEFGERGDTHGKQLLARDRRVSNLTKSPREPVLVRWFGGEQSDNCQQWRPVSNEWPLGLPPNPRTHSQRDWFKEAVAELVDAKGQRCL